MNLFWQSLSQAGVWACVAFGAGVLLAVTGLFFSDVPRRRRRMPMSPSAAVSQVSAGVIGEEGTWRRKFFVGLLCVVFVLPVSFWPSVLLAVILPMILGVAVVAVGGIYVFYREVAWRALCRREPEGAGVLLLSWGLGLRLMFQRMRRKREGAQTKEARDR